MVHGERDHPSSVLPTADLRIEVGRRSRDRSIELDCSLCLSSGPGRLGDQLATTTVAGTNHVDEAAGVLQLALE